MGMTTQLLMNFRSSQALQMLQITLDTSSPELLQKLEESWVLDPHLKALISELQRQNGTLKAYFGW